MAMAPQQLGIGITRRFTRPGVDPYDTVEWERRDSRIRVRRESESDAAARSEVPDTAEVQVIRVLGDTPRARTRLAADWGDGRAVVAVLAG